MSNSVLDHLRDKNVSARYVEGGIKAWQGAGGEVNRVTLVLALRSRRVPLSASRARSGHQRERRNVGPLSCGQFLPITASANLLKERGLDARTREFLRPRCSRVMVHEGPCLQFSEL